MKLSPQRTAIALVCALFNVIALSQQPPAAKVKSASAKQVVTPDAVTDVTTTGGTANFVPKFSGSTAVANSLIFDNGTNVGIGVGANPNSQVRLDIGGGMIVRGNTIVSRTGNATSSNAYPSYGFQFFSNVYNSSTKAGDNPYFSIQSEPTGNNTASPSATFNLLFSNNGATLAETGFYINPNGTLHFSPSQTFPIAAGPQGPQGPTGPAGPQGPQGASGSSFSVPYEASGNGNGGYLLALSDYGTSGGGGIYGAGESADGSSGLEFAGAGVTGQGGSGAGSGANYGGPGLAGYGGTSVRSATPAGPGVMGQGGDAGASDSFGGAGGSFYGGSSSYGAGVGVLAQGGNLASGVASEAEGAGIVAYPGQGSSYAGYFEGNVYVSGNLAKSGGSFKIDDPIDPANKYLSHSFVESPDMKNIYDGTAMTDGSGISVVTMPAWFEALNTDFRYQLTAIGQPAQAYVATEISNGIFTIKTDRPNVKVSWQVTATRQDAWANAHRIPVEEDKADKDKGRYLHPELFGHAGERSIGAIQPGRSNPAPQQQ